MLKKASLGFPAEAVSFGRSASRTPVFFQTFRRADSFRDTLSNEAKASLLRQRWSLVALAWIVRVAAGINLYASLLSQRPKVVHWLATWVPFEISEGRRVLMFLTAILLFVLASGLARGKRTAWVLTIAALVVAPALHLGHALNWKQLVLNGALIAFLVWHRRYFVAGSDQRSVRSALVICPLLALALLVFGTVRLYELRDQISGSDEWSACLQTASELIFVQNTLTQEALTVPMAHFFSVLRIGGASIAILGLFLTLRPVLSRLRERDESREKAQKLIDEYGQDSFDSYALLSDKSYFFTAQDQVMVPYVLVGNLAVALADPIGEPELHAMAIVDFALFCRRQDWEPVFYAVTQKMIPNYEQAGFSLFKIGEAAGLSTRDFHLKGGDFQNLRTIRNRAQKWGIRFRWYDASEGIDTVLERQLASISQSWIEMKKAREMSFDMGAFSLEDIRKNGVAVAIGPTGHALAFATWRPYAQGRGRALDLMRHLPIARNTIDFVLVESIFHFRAKGITDVCLGLAPLANTEGETSPLVTEEKAVQFLFKNLNHVYGYKSLFEFKRKYRPQWRGRYVAYRRGVHLPLVGLALVRVHAPDGLWKFLFR